MKAIKIRYVLKEEKTGLTELMVFCIGEIELHGGEWIYEQFESEYGCDGSCINESVNHCECGTIFDEYKIVSRDLYTGRKDKNGKEIYEGDIIQLTHDYNSELNKNGVVKWNEEQANFYVECDHWVPPLNSYLLKYEIIGNIHEN